MPYMCDFYGYTEEWFYDKTQYLINKRQILLNKIRKGDDDNLNEMQTSLFEQFRGNFERIAALRNAYKIAIRCIIEQLEKFVTNVRHAIKETTHREQWFGKFAGNLQQCNRSFIPVEVAKPNDWPVECDFNRFWESLFREIFSSERGRFLDSIAADLFVNNCRNACVVTQNGWKFMITLDIYPEKHFGDEQNESTYNMSQLWTEDDESDNESDC